MSTQNFLSTKILARTKLVSVILGTFILAGLLASLLNLDDLEIELVTGNIFLVDNNKGCTVEPHAAYIGFEICNESNEDQYNLKADFGGFTNSQFGLASGQVAEQIIDTLASGACQTLYWYTYYDCANPDIPVDASIVISDDIGNQFSHTETFLTVSTIDAGSGGELLSSFLIADTTIGVLLEYDCEYSLGSLKAGTKLSFQPAGNLDFSADCFQLVGSEIIYSEIPNVNLGDKDKLYYSNTGKASGSSNKFVVRYYFTNLCTRSDTSILKAYSASVSGQSF